MIRGKSDGRPSETPHFMTGTSAVLLSCENCPDDCSVMIRIATTIKTLSSQISTCLLRLYDYPVSSNIKMSLSFHQGGYNIFILANTGHLSTT